MSTEIDVLPCDLQQFFPSIDHEVLSRLLRKKLNDPGVLWIIEEILGSGTGVLAEEYQMVYFPGDDLFAIQRPRGLPSATSPASSGQTAISIHSITLSSVSFAVRVMCAMRMTSYCSLTRKTN